MRTFFALMMTLYSAIALSCSNSASINAETTASCKSLPRKIVLENRTTYSATVIMHSVDTTKWILKDTVYNKSIDAHASTDTITIDSDKRYLLSTSAELALGARGFNYAIPPTCSDTTFSYLIWNLRTIVDSLAQ